MVCKDFINRPSTDQTMVSAVGNQNISMEDLYDQSNGEEEPDGETTSDRNN